MAESLNLIIFLSSVIGIIAIVLGIDILRKIAGRLRTLLVLIILTTTIFTLNETVKVLNVLLGWDISYPDEVVKIILAVFLLITMFTMKSAIEHLGEVSYRKKKR